MVARALVHTALLSALTASVACTPHAAPAPTVDAGPVLREGPDLGTSVADAESDANGPDALATAPADAASAGACPAGMILVEGDYCTKLDLVCKDSWYAKWNDKTICNAFQEPSVCSGRKVKKRFCIDAYEYPNHKGERPRIFFNFPTAQHLCAAEGKRVWTETEWTMACEGPSYKPYPYGYVRDPKACNGDRQYIEPTVVARDRRGLPIFAFASKDPSVREPELERLWQGVESGSQPRCVSDYGVWDMPGNADELASSETPEPVSRFDNVTTGGPWLYGVRNQCRPKIYTHNEGFAYYYLSTRCCAEPDGQPTDPRSPKQIARGEKWRP